MSIICATTREGRHDTTLFNFANMRFVDSLLITSYIICMALTKQDLEAIGGVIDTKLAPLDGRFGALEGRFVVFEHEIKEVKKDIGGLREQIQQLTTTLDNFVKMMTDYKEEFSILKAEMDQVKKILKEKLGVEVAVQK